MHVKLSVLVLFLVSVCFCYPDRRVKTIYDREKEYRRFRNPATGEERFEKSLGKLKVMRDFTRYNHLASLSNSYMAFGTRNYVPFRKFINIRIGYQIPEGLPLGNRILPASYASIRVSSTDDIIISSPSKTLNEDGVWTGRIQTNVPTLSNNPITLKLSVYMSGKYAYVMTSFTADKGENIYKDVNLARYDITIDVYDVPGFEYNYIFRGEKHSDLAIDNSYMLDCVISRLAKVTKELLDIDMKQITILVNSKLPTNAVSYEPLIRLGKSHMWSPVSMSHECY